MKTISSDRKRVTATLPNETFEWLKEQSLGIRKPMAEIVRDLIMSEKDRHERLDKSMSS